MTLLKGFWQFLNTDVIKIPWGQVIEKGVDAAKATKELGESWEKQAKNIERLKPYWSQIEPLVKVLNEPVTQLAIAGLPFVSIGIGLLRIYLDLSKEKPTYQSAVTIAVQLAYLQSLEVVLKNISDETLKAKLQKISLKHLVERQLNSLDKEISLDEAKAVVSRFPESALAQQFSEVLREQFLQAEISNKDVQRVGEQVKWGTHQYLHQAIAEAGDSVEPLSEAYRTGGQKVLDRYDSIDTYLNEKIAPLPDEQIFDEKSFSVRFRDLYIPLQVQPLTQSGEVARNRNLINVHDWALGMLESQDAPRKVMFIEGEAGRGKSVFCRMFADLVRQELKFSFIPLVIRLRDIRQVANNLTETLKTYSELEQRLFVQGDSAWLANRNTRFLIILDGFDELLLEGRATEGLQEFLPQVAAFQKESHHQCIVTGRPLALQGVDRLIEQTKGLERVRLEPMNNPLRQQWLDKWQEFFGQEEVEQFQKFIQVCPEEIAELSREPLLLYLLARLHREDRISSNMFTEVEVTGDRKVQAKLMVYREAVNWVLEKQRQDQNERLSGLELEDLRGVLQEAALCIVQSGNETAQLSMLKSRFQDPLHPVAKLLQRASETIRQSEDKTLNNLLTTFYLKRGEGDKQGAVEFTHKSFGEYLFTERLLKALEDWTRLGERNRPLMDEKTVDGQIYDLLGYGGLSSEIVNYIFELITKSNIDQILLFKRLDEFYERWVEGEFINDPPNNNLPQKKMLQLREQGIKTGLKQIDVFAGLNVMILLFKLHAAAQPEGYPNLRSKPNISFHSCIRSDTGEFYENRLLDLINYANSLGLWTFTIYVGPHLYRATLYRATLHSANLSSVNLTSANLVGATLYSTNLIRATLYRATLYRANLTSANLTSANLREANLIGANLTRASLIGATLTEANLTSANLTEANLRKAELQGTRFGQNKGLSEADRADYKARGAIFEGE